MGKMSKGGGLGACQHFGSTFVGLCLVEFDFWTTLGYLKVLKHKKSIPRPILFSEANNVKAYTVLSHFVKCRYLHIKMLSNCPT